MQTEPMHDYAVGDGVEIRDDLAPDAKLDAIMESQARVEDKIDAFAELLAEYRPLLDAASAKVARRERTLRRFGA